MKIILNESQYKKLIDSELDEMMMSDHGGVRVDSRIFDPKKKFLTVVVGNPTDHYSKFEDIFRVFKEDKILEDIKRKLDYLSKKNFFFKNKVGIILHKFNFNPKNDYLPILSGPNYLTPEEKKELINDPKNVIYYSDKQKHEGERTIGDCLLAVAEGDSIITIYFGRIGYFNKNLKEIITDPYSIEFYLKEKSFKK